MSALQEPTAVASTAGGSECHWCRREAPCECSSLVDRIHGDTTCLCTCGGCDVADATPEEEARMIRHAVRRGLL